MKTYEEFIEETYDYISANRSSIDDAVLNNFLAGLDSVKPEENAKSTIKVNFDPRDNSLTDEARIWIPNLGVDPNTSYWRRNSNNGTYIDSIVKKNFWFNDILRFTEAHTGYRSSGVIEFHSTRWNKTVYVRLGQVSGLLRNMRQGWFVGRFRFAASGELKLCPEVQ